MGISNGSIIFTADDEEPSCFRCMNVTTEIPTKYCCDKCGPEYGWAHYCRPIHEKEFEEIIDKAIKVIY